VPQPEPPIVGVQHVVIVHVPAASESDSVGHAREQAPQPPTLRGHADAADANICRDLDRVWTLSSWTLGTASAQAAPTDASNNQYIVIYITYNI